MVQRLVRQLRLSLVSKTLFFHQNILVNAQQLCQVNEFWRWVRGIVQEDWSFKSICDNAVSWDRR
jgi:hypothetical protein